VQGTGVGGVDDHPPEVDLVLRAKLGQERLVELLPDARRLPLAQAVEQGHPAAAHLRREVLPREAGLQDEQDAAQAHAVGDPRVPALGARLVHRQQRLDDRPQRVGDKDLGHAILLEGMRRLSPVAH
jgi:hypothetical protein